MIEWKWKWDPSKIVEDKGGRLIKRPEYSYVDDKKTARIFYDTPDPSTISDPIKEYLVNFNQIYPLLKELGMKPCGICALKNTRTTFDLIDPYLNLNIKKASRVFDLYIPPIKIKQEDLQDSFSQAADYIEGLPNSGKPEFILNFSNRISISSRFASKQYGFKLSNLSFDNVPWSATNALDKYFMDLIKDSEKERLASHYFMAVSKTSDFVKGWSTVKGMFRS